MTDAYPGRTFSGTVLAISPAVDPATNAALARIRVMNGGGLLKVGLFAEARVQLGEHANALIIPPAALVRDQRGTAVYVLSRRHGHAHGGDSRHRARQTPSKCSRE